MLISFLVPETEKRKISSDSGTKLFMANLEKSEKPETSTEPEKTNIKEYNLKNFVLEKESSLSTKSQQKYFKDKDLQNEKTDDFENLLKKTKISKNRFEHKKSSVENKSKKTGVYKASDTDSPPFVIESTRPEFPVSAKRMGIKEGKIVLRFVVDKNGKAKNIEVESSTHDKIFEESAVKALKKWRFSPGEKNGEKVSTLVYLPVRYVYKD
ncbi:MAG: energy transducer TonB [Thermodesulfobacteriota bacterium]